MFERCYTRRALAKRWRTSESRVKALIADGHLSAFSLPGSRTVLISPEDVRAYEQSQQLSTGRRSAALPVRDHFRGIG